MEKTREVLRSCVLNVYCQAQHLNIWNKDDNPIKGGRARFTERKPNADHTQTIKDTQNTREA